jgi:hypothetical protein
MNGASVGRAVRQRATATRAAWQFAVVAAALWLAGCVAVPYRTVSLIFDGRDPGMLGTDPDDLVIAQVTARLIHDRLGLPFPAETTVNLYVNEATFAEGLAREGRVHSDDAWDKSRRAIGVASPRGLFLRADRFASMALIERVALIAHELAHVTQLQMRRGGRSHAPQWIREGHADWVKFRILELLDLRPYDESRDRVRRSVLRSSTPIHFFPNLTALSRGDRWTEAHNRLGYAATYGQAFLALDRLVERYGIDRLHEFLWRFALDTDPRSHWSTIFPIPFAAFVQEFRTHLEELQ